jgi:tRNA dimethylallyltransferase
MTRPALRYIAIAGPTASGKTAAALAVAQACAARGGPAVEIISVDSALVYRGMDIGTAKPSAAELAVCPHHLIDLIDPDQAYSAAEFVADATRLIEQICARGALPLLVGGTMLYFKALIDGIDALPAADPALRAELEARAAAIGWPALHAELALVDPVSAARLAPNDAQRIQRALEVWHLTGQPLSSLHSGRFAKPAADPTGRAAEATPPDHLLIALEPASRAWLHERIGQRFQAMLAAGFVAELQHLRARGDLYPDLPSMRCVGYRQGWELLDEAGDDLSRLRLDLLIERGSAATRQLAKRQLTWLRSMPTRRVIACDGADPQAELLALLAPVLAGWR